MVHSSTELPKWSEEPLRDESLLLAEEEMIYLWILYHFCQSMMMTSWPPLSFINTWHINQFENGHQKCKIQLKKNMKWTNRSLIKIILLPPSVKSLQQMKKPRKTHMRHFIVLGTSIHSWSSFIRGKEAEEKNLAKLTLVVNFIRKHFHSQHNFPSRIFCLWVRTSRIRNLWFAEFSPWTLYITIYVTGTGTGLGRSQCSQLQW